MSDNARPTPAPWTQDQVEIRGENGKRSVVWELGANQDADAALIIAACNACQSLNPANPQAIADNLVALFQAAAKGPHLFHAAMRTICGADWKTDTPLSVLRSRWRDRLR